jgi:DNA-binding CsgD family transcriptional regulator
MDPVDRAVAMLLLARLGIRRGTGEYGELLSEAEAIAARLETTQLRWALAALAAERAWLSGDLAAAVPELERCYRAACADRMARPIGELGAWLVRAGALEAIDEDAAEPYRLEAAGDPRGAATEWERRGMTFEAARALTGSLDPADLQHAHAILTRLGAAAWAGRVAAMLRQRGAAVPRGPRPTTSADPSGLTEREAEIARLLATGLSNAEIATSLVVSEKTVAHHVSAILAKLGVRRRAAVATALAEVAAG